MSIRRRLLRALAVLAGGGVLVFAGLAGGVWWLNTANGNEWIRKQLLTQVGPYLPEATLSLERLHLTLLGELELSGVSLVRWDGENLVSIERIRLDLDPARLLGSQMNLGTLQIDEPVVRVEVLEDGTMDWVKALGLASDEEDDTPAEPWAGMDTRIVVDSVKIHEGSLSYVQDGESFDVTAIGFGTRISAGGGRLAALHEVSLDFIPGSYDPVALTGDIRYHQGTLVLDAVDLNFGETAAQIMGTIGQVEVEPSLGLQLDLLPIAAGVASPWTEDQTPAQDINLSSRIHGPLSDLRLDAIVTTVSGQEAKLGGQVDLTAEVLTWEGYLETEGLDVDPLVPAVTEPVRLAGRYDVTGSGTEWPAGIDARITAEAPQQTIWGQQVDQISIDANLAAGKLRFTKGKVRHPVGSVSVLSGDIDLVREEVKVTLDASLPTLSALSDFGVVGYRGSASARGPVTVRYGAEPLTVDAALSVSGRNIGSKDFTLDGVDTSQLVVSVVGSNVTFSGGASLRGLEASGVLIESLDVRDLTGKYAESGAVTTSSVLELHRLQVGDGTFVLDELAGSVQAGVDTQGQPVLDTALQLGAMHIAPIQYSLDGGPVELELEDNELFADLTLRRHDRVVVNTSARGDLDDGRWTVQELLIFPSDKRGLVTPASEPIEFQLVDDGVKGVQLVLVLASEDPDEVDPRKLEREQASYISLQGGTVGDDPDVRLTAKRVELGWVSDMVNLFFSAEDGTPAIANMKGSVDAELSVVGLDENAAITGAVDLTGMTYPEMVSNVSLKLGVGGRLGRPTADLSIRDAKGLLLAAKADVPLDLETMMPPCDEPLAVRMMVAPSKLSRLAQRFPAAGELPEGEISADLHVTGPVCDPEIDVTAAVATPVGAHGEYGRVDATIVRGEEGFVLEAGVDEGGIRRLSMDGTATDQLSEVIRWAVEGGEEPDLADPATYISSMDIAMTPTSMPLSLLKKLAGVDTRIEGNIGGVLQVSGSISDPQALAVLTLADAQIGEVELEAGHLNLLPEVAEDGSHTGYTLDTSLDFSDEEKLAVTGRMPLTIARLRDEEEDELYAAQGWQLSTVGTAKLPLATLNGVVDGVEGAKGTIGMTGELTGSLAQLQPSALLSLEDATIGYTPLEVVYDDINLELRVAPDKLQIRELSMISRPMYGVLGTRAAGTMNLESTVGLDQLNPSSVDMTISMHDFWLSATSEMRIAGSTMADRPLRVTNSYPALRVRGGVVLTEGSLSFGESFWVEGSGLALDDRIHVVRTDNDAVRKEVEEEVPFELMEKLDARLTVDLSKKLKVNVEMPLSQDYGKQFAALSTLYVNAEMDGVLEAGYIRNDVWLEGDVEFTRGEIESFGRKFSLDAGSQVIFSGTNYANPNLEMAARYSTSSYGDVVMKITDTAMSPSISLDSENTDNYYDQSDLFAILFLGKPASAMADSEGESNSALMSAALSQVTGSVGSALSGTLVDEVDFDTSGVRVGKAINDRLFLNYDRNLDPEEGENRNQVTLEWIISRRAFAEFMTGDEAQSSAELYWRMLFGKQATRQGGPRKPPPGSPPPDGGPPPEAGSPPEDEPLPEPATDAPPDSTSPIDEAE